MNKSRVLLASLLTVLATTASAQSMVLDINAGSSNSSPGVLTVVGETLFFSAVDAVNGRELWKSDGTAAGTVLLADINPGSANSTPTLPTVMDDVLYFRATDGVNGVELWKSDGTAAG